MCGICGELNLRRQSVDPQTIQKMALSIAHRGPDDYGSFCEGPIGLGHRRLSIIDLSPNGRQPMWSSDRSLVIVYNGEIYNYQRIRRDLVGEGYRFMSTTDTEVIVNAIHCWGMESALKRFIGMFAFAVWDTKNRLLYLCRDRAGIKPMYYYLSPDAFLFGSELKSLMCHPSFAGDLDLSSLAQYFVVGYIPDPRSVFRNTYKLTPGHYLVVDESGRHHAQKYWGLEGIERGSFKGSFEDAAICLEDLLESAFSYRLIADVPVGVFLSGGIDSSVVSAVLRKRVGADILNITIGFEDRAYDEAPKAKAVAQELGIKHVVHYVTSGEAQQVLHKFCDIYDEPFSDTSGIPTYILSSVARDYVKVALSADGGDEQFCGYESYSQYARLYRLLGRYPSGLRHGASALLQGLPYKWLLSWGGRGEDGDLYFPQRIARYEKLLKLIAVTSPEQLMRLMNQKAWSEREVVSLVHAAITDVYDGSVFSSSALKELRGELLDAFMRLDYNSFLRDDILTKVDRASMAVSLECRDPFLDHRIAELAYSLPLDYLYGGSEHKRILKHLLKKWLSGHLISSPKRGFMIPLYYWLKGPWKPVVMEYLSPGEVKHVGILNEEMVEEEVENFYRYKGCRAERLWTLLNFQMWACRWYQRTA